jgi:hypothetical protein
MTKTELQKLNSDMVKFLIGLCRLSDDYWSANRTPDTERRYQKARRLIARAGHKYEPSAKKP